MIQEEYAPCHKGSGIESSNVLCDVDCHLFVRVCYLFVPCPRPFLEFSTFKYQRILSPLREQGAVSRKPRKLFGPVKPLQNLEPCEYGAVLFTYSKDERRFPSYKKIRAYTLLRF